MTATTSTALAPIQPAFTDAERLALAGFLAGYRGLTPRRLHTRPAPVHQLVPGPLASAVLRPPRGHRDLRPGTGSTRPCPRDRHAAAVHRRRVLQVRGRGRAPRAFPGRARPPSPAGLRVARHRPGPQRARRDASRRRARPARRARPDLAAGAERAPGLRGHRRDIQHLGSERGHRTLVITRKGGKVVTIPLAPRTARAIDLAIGEHTEGPLFLAADGRRLDRHGAARVVRRAAHRAGIAKHVSPHTLRHAFITAALDAGVPLRDVQEAASHADPRTTMRYDRARTSLDRHATYVVAAFIAGAAR
jgi:integrase-like protein